MHVILRGIDRGAVFFASGDYHYFLARLSEAGAGQSVQVHAYVLMTNHIHLLLTAESDDGGSRVMKSVGQRHVQHVNRTYHRTGPLFEGRFRSSLVEADEYLLACQRYIELNPVRAGMVEAPGDYPWSSYRANAHGAEDRVVTPSPLYTALGSSAETRQLAYRALFADVLSDDLLDRVRGCVNGGFVLGNARFEREVAAMVGRRTWKGSPGRPKREASDEG
jgi:putative transposase